MKDRMLFVDTETSGLEKEDDIILEVGLALVTLDMKVEAEVSVLIKPESYNIHSREQLEQWCVHYETKDGVQVEDPLVKDMHTKSGLFDDLYDGQHTPMMLPLAEYALMDWLTRNGIPLGALPMAGNNVANFDRPFLKMGMPKLEAAFHYRNIDISSIKELCRLYNPRIAENKPKPQGEHRVIGDIHDSIAELEYYLQEFIYVA